MKTDWRQVAEKLGVKREQVETFMKSEMLEGLAKNSKLDAKTVESLLKEKYSPRDITIAGRIANSSGKNVKAVIAKKKINNNWEDVAKEFNVDFSKINERGAASVMVAASAEITNAAINLNARKLKKIKILNLTNSAQLQNGCAFFVAKIIALL